MQYLAVGVNWAGYMLAACWFMTGLAYRIPTVRRAAKAGGITPSGLGFLGVVLPSVALIYFIQPLSAEAPLAYRFLIAGGTLALVAWVFTGIRAAVPTMWDDIWK